MRNILFIILLMATSGAWAQTTMRSVFIAMPDTIVPYLTQNNRLDFADFIDSGMKAEVPNSLDGKSRMDQMTDRHALLTLSESSQIELLLLDSTEAYNGMAQIVCMIWTYGTDTRESVVHFFTTAWHELPTNRFALLPDDMFTASFSDEFQLVLKPSGYFDTPANEEQKNNPKMSTTLKWDGKRFN